jgi:site-specific DNA recombinase
LRKIALYARVSTEEQAKVEEGSIKNQIENLDRWVAGENLKYSGKWGRIAGQYIDDGFSGKDLNRPQVKRLLLDISKGHIDTILMTEVSRLSRSVKDWIDLRAFFEEHSVAFITLRQNFDTSTAMGRAMLSFAIEFSQLEREQTAERVKVSSFARASRGLWTGGSVPFSLEKSERPGHLKVNVAKQIIANEIFDAFINEAGYLSKTVSIINEAGYLRGAGQPWTFQLLAAWMRNRALIGEVEVNAKNRSQDQDRLADGDKYKIVTAVWEPVIDVAKWEKANQLLDQNYQRLKVPQWKYHEYVLTGLVECPNGHSLVGSSGWGRSKIKYTHYVHPGDVRGKCDCGFATIPAEKIESKIIKDLKALARTPLVVTELTKLANQEFATKQPSYNEVLQTTRRQRDTLLKKLDQITDQALMAASPAESRMWTEKGHRLQLQVDQLEKELELLKTRETDRSSNLLDDKAIKEALDRFSDDFGDLPVATRRSFITSILRRVKLQKDGIVLCIGNPGFGLEGLSSDLLGCYPGGPKLVHSKGWLPETSDIRTKPCLGGTC